MSNESDATGSGAAADRDPTPEEGRATAPAGFELGTDGPRMLLAGLDGSDSSWRATAYAAGLARRQHATLAVVYVQPVLAAATALAGAAVEETTRQIADELLTALREAELRLRGVWQLDWRFVTLRGDPYLELARMADELRADGVVVGASEQAGHRVIGSVAVRLVKAGRWPVTVVP